jgi:hypothetical protein
MDYDLGVGQKGDVGLVEVRNVFPYKDLVFYSSQGNDLLKLVSKKGVQGVFCSRRDDIPDNVIGAFEALVRKVLDIDHSRGIVMGASSDIDHAINDCLMCLFDKNEPPVIKQGLDEVARKMKDKEKDLGKAVKKIAAIKHVAEIMEHHHVYTSNDRLGLLREMLSKVGSYDEECKAMKAYASDTIPKRNDLAHRRVRQEGFSRKLFDRNGKEFTGAEMRALRGVLLDYQEMFEALANKLKPASAGS